MSDELKTDHRTSRAVRQVCSALLLFLLLIIGKSSAAGPIMPQSDSPSHRLLPLPNGAGGDLSQQTALLKQLRSMINAQNPEVSPAGQDAAAARSDRQPPPISIDQLQQLQQSLKPFADQLPPGLLPPSLDSVPRDQLAQALSDPERQQQLRQLLEQFARNGRLPETPPGDAQQTPNLPFLPPQLRRPQDTTNRPSPDTRQPETARPDTPRSDTPRMDTPRMDTPRPDTSRMDTPRMDNAQSGRRAGQPTQEPAGQPAENQTRLGNPPPGENPSSRQNSPPVPRANQTPELRQNNDSASANRPTPAMSPLPDPQSLQAMQTIVRRWLDQHDASSRVPGANGASSNSSTSEPGAAAIGGSLSNTDDGNRGSAEPSDSGLTIPRSALAQALSDPNLLEDVRSELESIRKAVPSQQYDGSSRSSSGTPAKADGGRDVDRTADPLTGRSLPRTDPNQRSRDVNRSVDPLTGRSELQAAADNYDIKSELRQRGFRGALKKLVEQAKQQTASSGGTSPSAPSAETGDAGAATSAGGSRTTSQNPGFEKALIRTLDGLREDVLELAKDGLANRKEQSQANRPGVQPAAPDRRDQNRAADASRQARFSQQNRGKGPLDNIRQTTSEWFSGLAQAPAQTGGNARSSGSDAADVFSEGSIATMVISVVVIAALLIGLLLLATRQTGLWSGASPLENRDATILPEQITTRQDVVRAFHQLIARPATAHSGRVHPWWTHRDAARQISTATPSIQNAIHILADVYEQARYLPEDAQLTADQITDVRSALQQCEAGGRA